MKMDFLNVANKNYIITGISNKKSVAYSVAALLKKNGANITLLVQSQDHIERVEKLFPDEKILICNVQNKESIKNIKLYLESKGDLYSGFLHSIAFANYLNAPVNFLDTSLEDFQEAQEISQFSFIELSNAFKNSFTKEASLVTISISNTKATSYGYMGPIKAGLEAIIPFMAKGFSEFSHIRVNGVASGPLKTSASAGIPGYINNYIYAERLTLRKRALLTEEVANTVCFLLSDRSSGINGTTVLVDAGLNCNFFDQQIVQTVVDHGNMSN